MWRFGPHSNSSCPCFPALFTGIFYHLALFISFSSYLREKGHLPVTFFNSLKYRQLAVLSFWYSYAKIQVSPPRLRVRRLLGNQMAGVNTASPTAVVSPGLETM